MSTGGDGSSVTEGPLDAVVVGGGIAGLTAAWALRDRNALVLEASDRVGGRIWSEPRGEYWLNFGAHVFGSATSATGDLLSSLGVDARAVPGRLAAAALNGKIVSRGPVELFPVRLPMPVRSRIALVRAGVKLRLAVREYARLAAPIPGEDPAERQARMLAFLDDRSFTEFIGPLPADVDALFRSTLTRSSGEPEQLAAGYGVGYFHLVWNRAEGLSRTIMGGSSRLIEALATELGPRVITSASATSVATDGDGVVVRYRQKGAERELRTRTAVVATPAYVTREIIPALPEETRAALAAITYGPYVVGAFSTNERTRTPWDEIYALATPRRSFSMLFNTVNVLRAEGARSPGGSLMVYAAAQRARDLGGLDDAEVADRFLADLHDLYPHARGVVEDVVIRRWERGLPYPQPGRSALQPALTRSLAPIHLAGDYLGTWYTETAVQTAIRAARAIAADLDSTAGGQPESANARTDASASAS
jgi:oxygen-dependent protoporphyrinogen oxidase